MNSDPKIAPAGSIPYTSDFSEGSEESEVININDGGEGTHSMDKKRYVEGYVKHLDEALKSLFDEEKENEIINADKAALGDDYQEFEETISAAYDMVEQARNLLQKYAETL